MTTSDVAARILALCVAMYVGIGICWVIYWYAKSYWVAQRSIVKWYRVGLLCISWSTMSVGMQVLNKVLMTSLKAPAVVSTVQMLLAVLLVGPFFARQVLEAPAKELGRWMVVPLFFAAMLSTSCYTYEYISLSLLTVVRNLTPLVVLPIERMVMPPEKQPQVTSGILMALGITVVGTVAYVGHLRSISWIGIAFALANMVLAACDRLIQRFLLTGPCKDLQSGVCTTVNNAVGMVPTVILALSTHQMSGLSDHAQAEGGWRDARVLCLLVLSGVVGIGICYLGFECQREISATSFFVMQNMAKMAVVCAGVLIFQDPIQSPYSGMGLLLSLGGSFAYGRLQMVVPGESKPLVERKLKLDPTDAPEGSSA